MPAAQISTETGASPAAVADRLTVEWPKNPARSGWWRVTVPGELGERRRLVYEIGRLAPQTRSPLKSTVGFDPQRPLSLRAGNGSSCPKAVICPTCSEYAARPLLTQAVAIGDCHGQELNRRNLHDPALSPAQFEPWPRGLAVARRQTKGLENGIPDWKSVSLVRRARKYPRAPHAGLPRRSHASRYRPHTNGISLPAHVGPGKRARCARRRSSRFCWLLGLARYWVLLKFILWVRGKIRLESLFSAKAISFG